MQNTIFNTLKDNCKPSVHSNVECISFDSKVGKHEISFYAEQQNGYEVTVEDFGCVVGGLWKQEEPTPNQLAELQQIINANVAVLQNQTSDCIDADFDGDYYNYYGVSQAMFY